MDQTIHGARSLRKYYYILGYLPNSGEFKVVMELHGVIELDQYITTFKF